MLIGEVAQPVPLRRTFDYEIPDALRPAARPGVRVRAAFGPRRLVGTLMSVREGVSSRALKPLEAVLDPEPLLTSDLIDLSRWLARHYCAPLGDCVKALLPPFVRSPSETAAPAASCAQGEAAGPPAPDRHPADAAGPGAPAGFALTSGQAAALGGLCERLSSRRFGAALLFGVPASGKTEVYLRLMREASRGGGQTLYLLPEISLTRPFFDELNGRAGFPVALWHSQLGIRERRSVWLGLRRGEVRAVVGARSAVLLPFRDLRLTVVDEEQDESFKQESPPPLYHAREVALERARRSNSLVVLGSATPSMEAMAAVESGAWVLHALPDRVAATSRPRVEVIAKPRGTGFCLGEELLDRIKDRLRRREQMILLVNRRGYSNYVICRRCGWVARCKFCGIAFVHHQQGESAPEGFRLQCHHCGRSAAVPPSCPLCRTSVLAFAGVGTQKVVAELRARLPGARVLRMDRDTVSKERRQETRIYDRFKAAKADILVGTKLVAKGFHFPDVTLVGVVDADTMLHMPDFRAAERTVQLLVQAAGRSGRADKPGEVLVQTAQTDHYAIQAVARGDYLRYAKQELEFRRELDYPPSSALVRLVLSGTAREKVAEAAGALAAGLSERLAGFPFALLGPSPAVHEKLRGRWRHHVLVKLKDAARLEECLEAIAGGPAFSGVRLQIHVDPYNLF